MMKYFLKELVVQWDFIIKLHLMYIQSTIIYCMDVRIINALYHELYRLYKRKPDSPMLVIKNHIKLSEYSAYIENVL